MVNGDAETEGFHVAGVGHDLAGGLDDFLSTLIIAGIETVQVRNPIPAGAELGTGQVHTIGDAEVVERNQKVVVQSRPEPEFARDPTVKVFGHDVLAVHPLRGCGQPQELFAPIEMLDDAFVRSACAVVEFVDDHHIEVITVQLGVDRFLRQRLDGREHMVPLGRPVVPAQQLAERAVTQHVSEGSQGLLQDFTTMRHEQQPRAWALGVFT